MREIDPGAEPVSFTEWRAGSQNDINYGYDLIPAELRVCIKEALIADQRGICAYTGISIDVSRSHIEHLLPQAHCKGEYEHEDVAYGNMVACYPAPGSGHVPFGAHRKADWPPPSEQYLFVSPRSTGCEARFKFDMRGKISVAGNDNAARETVERLGLNHTRLEGLRREAISATLKWKEKKPLLDLPSARKRLTSLENAENGEGRLEPFCFALKQALRKYISLVESIRKGKRGA
jgi:uncharacterized protein (TIGR02646 family)